MSETEKKESPIKYVLVEMIRANETKLLSSSITAGLFKGLRCEDMTGSDKKEKEQLFVLLEDKEKAFRALALEYYNIMSFEVYDGATKILSFYRASTEDQAAAFDQAAQIINELHEAQRTLADDENVIDITTYSTIPSAYGSGDVNKSTGTQASSAFPARSNTNTVHQHRNTQSWQKKDPEPCLIKRAGKKPTKAAMDAMRKKVIQLDSGDYTVTLPEIEGDDDDEEPIAVSDNAYNAQYFGCG